MIRFRAQRTPVAKEMQGEIEDALKRTVRRQRIIIGATGAAALAATVGLTVVSLSGTGNSTAPAFHASTVTTVPSKSTNVQPSQPNASNQGQATPQTTVPYAVPPQLQQLINKVQGDLSSASGDLQNINRKIPQIQSDITQAKTSAASIESEIPQTGHNVGLAVEVSAGGLAVLLVGATVLILLSQRKTRRAVSPPKPHDS